MSFSLASLVTLNQIFPLKEMTEQMFKWGGSGSKEVIGAGVITPAVVSIYNTIQASCATSCEFTLVSGEQWGALIAGAVVLYAHLRSKALAARVEA